FKTMRLNGLQKPEDKEVGGGTIEDAVRYLADYGSRDVSEWPYPDVGGRSLRDVLKMARAARLIYKSDFWPDLIERLEVKLDETVAAVQERGEGDGEAVVEDGEPNGMFDALKIIEGSVAMQAEQQLIPDLQRWFTSYLEWVDGSPEATQERNARNNHGTYFTVQYISILEFLGRNEEATAMAEDAKDRRVGSQIRRDGAQPHETIRPISYFYSTFNLQGLMMLSMQAEAHGVDLWNHKGPI
ncbi:hypothetical protein BGZ47_004436, partial [Haplosporangium gracile]